MFYDLAAQTLRALIQAFPNATHKHIKDAVDYRQNRPDTEINNLSFYPNEITLRKDNAGQVTVTWVSTASFNKPIVLDEIQITSSDDIAGWISVTKTEILTNALNTLLAIFKDDEIMPRGQIAAVELALQGSYLMHRCGVDFKSTVDRVAKILEPRMDHLWKRNAKDGQDRFLIVLKGGGGDGWLFGRTPSGEDQLTWRLILPVMAGMTLDVAGENLLGAAEFAETRLLRVLVDAVLWYLVCVPEAISRRPPNWLPPPTTPQPWTP